jgi:siroheme synthase
MNVRDAVGSDTGAVADLLGTHQRAAERLVRDRHVRVAARGDEIAAVLAFEATDAVRVTRLAGERDALVELLASPVRFAESEGVVVEAFPDDERAEAALAAAGFERAGETDTGERYVTRTSGR